MNSREIRDAVASKVPAVTLVFWIIKIAATTLGETGGDTVTMTLYWPDPPADGVVSCHACRARSSALQIAAKEISSLALSGDDRRLNDSRDDDGGFRRPFPGYRICGRFDASLRLS